MARQTISVILGVRNEERQIARCLDALTWADEVLVIDNRSTDKTEQIARTYSNVRFFQFDDYLNAKMNFGIENSTGDWLLRLDADEVVTRELEREIVEEVLEKPESPFDGYWIPNRVYFFGKWLRYGVAYDDRFGKDKIGFGFRKTMWKRGFAWYEVKREHEDISVKGRWGLLRNPYDHYSHSTVSQWIQKMNYYTDRDLERTNVLGEGFVLPKPGKTLVAMAKIFYDFQVRRKGYKDGIHGFMASALNTIYLLAWRCKLWEKHAREAREGEIVDY